MAELRSIVIESGNQKQISSTDILLIGAGVDSSTIGPLVVGTTKANAIEIGKSGITTTNKGDFKVEGNFVVEGTTSTVESETVIVNDNHLYLNNGYTTVSAQTGGLAVNYLPTATTDTVTAGAFVAGVASTSNPTVVTVGAATFSAGDLIQVSGSAENDGLYEVNSHAANLLTIRGIGTVAATEDFTQNNFVANASDNATLTKVNVSVIRVGTDGIPETAAGSVTPFTFADLSIAADLANNFVFAHDVTTQAISGADTFQDITFATDDEVDGWTHGSGADFTCNQSGRYSVTLDLNIEKTSGGSAGFGWRALFNSLEVTGSASGIDVATNNLNIKISKSIIVNATTGQILKLQIAGSTTNIQISPGPNPGSATTNPSATVKIERIT